MRGASKGLVIVALVSLVGAGALFGKVLAGALALEPAPEPAPLELEAAVMRGGAELLYSSDGERPSEARMRAADAAPLGDRAVVPPADAAVEGPPPAMVGMAIESDPFLPSRTRASRYLLPDEIPDEEEEEDPRDRDLPDVNVFGAALIGNSGIALVQVGDEEPRVLQIGETYMGVTLQAVNGESVTLVSEGTEMNVGVTTQPTPREREARAERNARNSRNSNNNNNRGRGEDLSFSAPIQWSPDGTYQFVYSLSGGLLSAGARETVDLVTATDTSGQVLRRLIVRDTGGGGGGN